MTSVLIYIGLGLFCVGLGMADGKKRGIVALLLLTALWPLWVPIAVGFLIGRRLNR